MLSIESVLQPHLTYKQEVALHDCKLELYNPKLEEKQHLSARDVRNMFSTLYCLMKDRGLSSPLYSVCVDRIVPLLETLRAKRIKRCKAAKSDAESKLGTTFHTWADAKGRDYAYRHHWDILCGCKAACPESGAVTRVPGVLERWAQSPLPELGEARDLTAEETSVAGAQEEEQLEEEEKEKKKHAVALQLAEHLWTCREKCSSKTRLVVYDFLMLAGYDIGGENLAAVLMMPDNIKPSVSIMKEIKTLVEETGIRHLLTVTKSAWPSQAHACMKHYFGSRWETFRYYELFFPVARHVSVPRHLRISAEAAMRISQCRNVREMQESLPRIQAGFKPICKYYNFLPGDFVLCYSRCLVNGVIPVVRYVVSEHLAEAALKKSFTRLRMKVE